MKSKILGLLTVGLFALPLAASAAAISSRAALQARLGGSSTVEDFEGFVIGIGIGIADTVSCDTGNTLDATSICAGSEGPGQGPGLVEVGIALIKSTSDFQWNGVSYFGAPSQEFLINSQPLIIDFTSAVGAFGLDLRAFSGFGVTATMVLLGADDTTVIGTTSAIALSSSGLPVFAGWEDAGGIGSAFLTQTGQSWSPIIDNLVWGATAAVPEPGTLVLLGLGLAGLGLTRRRHFGSR